MGTLTILLLIAILVVSALLFFNKGEKAQEIKSILKDIYESLKNLFSNFKKLFLIIKELVQEKLDIEPSQFKDEKPESQKKVTAEPDIKNTNESEIIVEAAISSITLL